MTAGPTTSSNGSSVFPTSPAGSGGSSIPINSTTLLSPTGFSTSSPETSYPYVYPTVSEPFSSVGTVSPLVPSNTSAAAVSSTGSSFPYPTYGYPPPYGYSIPPPVASSSFGSVGPTGGSTFDPLSTGTGGTSTSPTAIYPNSTDTTGGPTGTGGTGTVSPTFVTSSPVYSYNPYPSSPEGTSTIHLTSTIEVSATYTSTVNNSIVSSSGTLSPVTQSVPVYPSYSFYTSSGEVLPTSLNSTTTLTTTSPYVSTSATSPTSPGGSSTGNTYLPPTGSGNGTASTGTLGPVGGTSSTTSTPTTLDTSTVTSTTTTKSVPTKYYWHHRRPHHRKPHRVSWPLISDY